MLQPKMKYRLSGKLNIVYIEKYNYWLLLAMNFFMQTKKNSKYFINLFKVILYCSAIYIKWKIW